MLFKTILFVGDHAQKYCELAISNENCSAQLLTYQRENIVTGEKAKVIFNQQELPFHTAYNMDGLCQDIVRLKDQLLIKCDILIGDPTELLFQAYVTELMESSELNVLPIVFFLYPVGMNSLDTRREISALILKMKLNNMLTYVVRNPMDTFVEVMNEVNNLASFTSITQLESSIENLDYLFGHDAEILI
jgi:hypothetical protein